LCRAQFEAASLFDYRRLPECFTGHARDVEHPFPATYPAANSPQAWSASTILTLMQSLLGLQPFAPLAVLLVDPRLPSWLPAVTLRHVRVGSARVSLHFQRQADGGTAFEILDLEGHLNVVRASSPWDDVLAPAEQLRERFG
jgi:hypothetical protein